LLLTNTHSELTATKNTT